jgi:heme/copper-type cytochrome/quinol oxidase subunit 2
MYGIIELHDHIFFFLNMVLFVVLFLLITTIDYFSYLKSSPLNKYLLRETVSQKYEWLRLNHGTAIEIVWTVVPSIILLFIAIPSFALLYATDELIDPSVTIQVIGHQWYWSYEYNDITTRDTSSSKFIDLTSFGGEVEKFIVGAAMASGINLTTHEELVSFAWAVDKAELWDLFGLKASTWEMYLRSMTDTAGIKSAYQDAFSIFRTYVFGRTWPISAFVEDNTYLLIDWGKCVGMWWKHQNLFGGISFDSFMRQEADLNIGEQRLYETDFPLVLPKFTHIRFMITSDDVIHSWAVPSLGIKVDAVPGRINHAHAYIKRSGVFYGQCSELCGVNHAFMPIQIIAFEPHMYYDYLRLMLVNKN